MQPHLYPKTVARVKHPTSDKSIVSTKNVLDTHPGNGSHVLTSRARIVVTCARQTDFKKYVSQFLTSPSLPCEI